MDAMLARIIVPMNHSKSGDSNRRWLAAIFALPQKALQRIASGRHRLRASSIAPRQLFLAQRQSDQSRQAKDLEVMCHCRRAHVIQSQPELDPLPGETMV